MAPTRTATTPDRDRLLAAARRGETDAFRRLVDPHRGELHAHCYRMLGSPHDADDALQDALVRAWRGLHGVREGAALRAWLYRIATNSCLDAIKRRPARMLPIESGPPLEPRDNPGEPIVEAAWLDPTRTSCWASRTDVQRPRPATSSARPSSLPSSRRCSTCRPSSARF